MTLRETLSQAVNGRGVTAEIYYDEGPEVQVKIVGNAGYGAQAWWRITGTNSGGDYSTHYIAQTDASSGSFEAENGHKYALQAIWGSESGISDGAFFTVNFDSGGGDSGGGEDIGSTARTLYLNQGEGTKLSVLFSDSSYYDQWTEFNGNTSAIIHYNGQDTITVGVEVLDGYELDYYDFDGYQLGYNVENLEIYTTASDMIYFQLASDGDARITTTATPIATARIYNKDISDWDRYAPYIYDKDSGWERYTPYIYNKSGASWDRYS